MNKYIFLFSAVIIFYAILFILNAIIFALLFKCIHSNSAIYSFFKKI